MPESRHVASPLSRLGQTYYMVSRADHAKLALRVVEGIAQGIPEADALKSSHRQIRLPPSPTHGVPERPCDYEAFLTMASPSQAGISRFVAGVTVAKSPTCPGLSAIKTVRLPLFGSSSVHTSLSAARWATLTGFASPELKVTSVAASKADGTSTVKRVPADTASVRTGSVSLSVIEGVPGGSEHERPPTRWMFIGAVAIGRV